MSVNIITQEQEKKLSNLVGKEKQEELAVVFELGEKYKKKGAELERKFWKSDDRRDFVRFCRNLTNAKKHITQYLSNSEKAILEKIDSAVREKFVDEYLEKVALYEVSKSIDIDNDNENQHVPYEIEYTSDSKVYIDDFIKNNKKLLSPGMQVHITYAKTLDNRFPLMIKEWSHYLQPGMSFSLSDLNLGYERINWLAKGWKDSLKPGMNFSFSNNNIQDRGIIMLVRERKNSLQAGMQLDFHENKIGENGIEVMAKERKDSLQPGMYINLSGNDFGDEGIKILANEWENSLHPGMFLDLENCNLTDACVDSLMQLKIKNNFSLFLADNNLSYEKQEELEKLFDSYNNQGLNCRVDFSSLPF